jgi:hypothetical protein
MGNEVLHGWARRQQHKKEQEYNAMPGINRKEKKPLLIYPTGKNRNRGGDLHPSWAGDSTVFRIGGSGVPQASEALQRAITDLGADDPFAGASAKLKEHYGIAVPANTIRAVTEKHGAAMLARQKPGTQVPAGAGVSRLIAEMDGSMVPVVETAASVAEEAPIDHRKTRKLSWMEARLSLAHEPGSMTPVFGATMGSVNKAGERLLVCALEAGAASQTKIHGLGAGAPWIFEQMDLQFGSQADFLVDFYHLCEYLSAAAEVVAGKEGIEKKAWMEEKKDGLKDSRWPELLETLRPYVEDASVRDQDAPVRACFRYISNRSNFLDYKGALAAGLPIGSGEIESAHRYVIQNRLKIAGAWWKMENLSSARGASEPRLGRLLELWTEGCVN